MAVLPTVSFGNATGTNIMGLITGIAVANGTGVMFTVNFTNPPDPMMYGPLVYYIHQFAVPADGNCTGTLAHLDPTDRGDLSGKHGNITSTTWNFAYFDFYLSTTPGSPYFFGDKSVIIHSSNARRLTCANFTMVFASTTALTNSSSPSPSGFMSGAGSTTGNFNIFAGAASFLAALCF